MSHDVDFGYVRGLDHEYNHVFLDSQMNISERMKFAGELPKLLGNFWRMHREVIAIHELLEAAAIDGCLDTMHASDCPLTQALDRLATLAESTDPDDDEDWVIG